jgi:AcrR family transcriptional regulator
MWGERGVEGVSLREIRIAAGQRNSSALQFHFGDRDGLLLAVAQRHLPRINALHEQLYAALLAEGRGDELEGLIEVMIRPTADYLRLGPSERAWVKISAQQAAQPEVAMGDVLDHAPAVALHVGATVHQQLSCSHGLPSDVVIERLVSVVLACNHLCADRARFEDAVASGDGPPADGVGLRRDLPFEQWRANLVDMAIGALSAPARPARPPLGRC